MNKTLLSASALLLICTGCSSLSRRNGENSAPQESDSQKIERLQNQNKDLATTLSSVSSKLEAVETRLASMNEKLDATRGRIDNLVDNQRAKPSPTKTVPTEGGVNLPPAGDDDAEAAFTADAPVRKYRQAMILFQSRNYPEASLGFSGFVDQYPDHPLAGSAQYYLGETYFKQKEYKLAVRELGRVITSYDRSPHIAETLRDLAYAEDKIGQAEDAARHRQLLTSLFPHSPAAHSNVANVANVASPADGEEGAEKTHTPVQAAPAQARPESQAPAQSPGAETNAAPSTALDAPPPTAPMESGHP